MQYPSTGFLPEAYMPPGTEPRSPVYLQPLKIESTNAVYTTPEVYI